MERIYNDNLLSNFLDLLILRSDISLFLNSTRDFILNVKLFQDLQFLNKKGDIFNSCLKLFADNQIITISKMRIDNQIQKSIIVYHSLLQLFNKLIIWLKLVLNFNYQFYFKKLTNFIDKNKKNGNESGSGNENENISVIMKKFKRKYSNFYKVLFITTNDNLFKIDLFLNYIKDTLFINVLNQEIQILIQKLTKWIIFQRIELKKFEKNLIYQFIIHLNEKEEEIEEKLQLFKILSWIYNEKESYWTLKVKE